MTTFYLIRHAEAEGNLYRRMHGQYDTMITPNGVKQIRALANRFAEIPIDLCYASDLLRTRTTAQSVVRTKNIPLHPEPAFREIQVGKWDNIDFGWLHTFEPDGIRQFTKDPIHWHIEGSETFSEYTNRFIHALTELAELYDGKNVAVFSHAVVMQGVMIALFPDHPTATMDNTAVTKLEYQNGSFQLCYLGDNSHLSPEISTLARIKKGIGRNNIWFQEETPWSFNVMSGETPAGVLHLKKIDSESGRIEYMELLPQFRGKALAIQLLGKAVFTMRENGIKNLSFKKPDNMLDALCRTIELIPDQDGICRMNIQLRMPELGI